MFKWRPSQKKSRMTVKSSNTWELHASEVTEDGGGGEEERGGQGWADTEMKEGDASHARLMSLGWPR